LEILDGATQRPQSTAVVSGIWEHVVERGVDEGDPCQTTAETRMADICGSQREKAPG